MGMGTGRKAGMRGRNLGVEVEIGMEWGTGFKEVGMTVGNGNNDSRENGNGNGYWVVGMGCWREEGNRNGF